MRKVHNSSCTFLSLFSFHFRIQCSGVFHFCFFLFLCCAAFKMCDVQCAFVEVALVHILKTEEKKRRSNYQHWRIMRMGFCWISRCECINWRHCVHHPPTMACICNHYTRQRRSNLEIFIHCRLNAA